MTRHFLTVLGTAISAVTLLDISAAAETPPGGLKFKTPDEAVKALETAVSTTNRNALGDLFGPDFRELVNPDEVQGAGELAEFSKAFEASHHLVMDSAGHATLEIGADRWPFPIPLVKTAAGWQFDTQSGVEELLNRRIGRNELDVLQVLRGYVQAQREYASRDRDGDGVLEFAQRIASSPEATDGLYWDPELNGEESPLGPLVAHAQDDGYGSRAFRKRDGLQPFHGYYFRILKGQGKHAPGGRYNYVINGNMIAGFGLIAWPAAYGDSGIMTFIVNQQGVIYQSDLGERTTRKASSVKAYDPAPVWTRAQD